MLAMGKERRVERFPDGSGVGGGSGAGDCAESVRLAGWRLAVLEFGLRRDSGIFDGRFAGGGDGVGLSLCMRGGGRGSSDGLCRASFVEMSTMRIVSLRLARRAGMRVRTFALGPVIASDSGERFRRTKNVLKFARDRLRASSPSFGRGRHGACYGRRRDS